MCLNVDILLKFYYKSIFLQIQCVIIYQFLYCYLCAYRYIYIWVFGHYVVLSMYNVCLCVE